MGNGLFTSYCAYQVLVMGNGVMCVWRKDEWTAALTIPGRVDTSLKMFPSCTALDVVDHSPEQATFVCAPMRCACICRWRYWQLCKATISQQASISCYTLNRWKCRSLHNIFWVIHHFSISISFFVAAIVISMSNIFPFHHPLALPNSQLWDVSVWFLRSILFPLSMRKMVFIPSRLQ